MWSTALKTGITRSCFSNGLKPSRSSFVTSIATSFRLVSPTSSFSSLSKLTPLSSSASASFVDASTFLGNAKLANSAFFSLHRPIAIDNDPDLVEQVLAFQQEQTNRAEAEAAGSFNTLPPLLPHPEGHPLPSVSVTALPNVVSQVDKDAVVNQFLSRFQESLNSEASQENKNGYSLDSVLRKRRKKMNKHKQRKRRRLARASRK